MGVALNSDKIIVIIDDIKKLISDCKTDCVIASGTSKNVRNDIKFVKIRCRSRIRRNVGANLLFPLSSLLSHFLFPPSRPSLSLSLSLLSPLSSTSPIHTFSHRPLSSSLLSPLSSFLSIPAQPPSLFPPSLSSLSLLPLSLHGISPPLLSPLSLSSLSLSTGSHRPFSLLPSLSSLTKFPRNFSHRPFSLLPSLSSLTKFHRNFSKKPPNRLTAARRNLAVRRLLHPTATSQSPPL